MRKLSHLNVCSLLLKSVCVLIISIFACQSGKAAHLIGGEITYRCLGYTNNTPLSNSRHYQFTINVFRDCQSGGSEFDSPGFVVKMNITVFQGGSQYGVYELNAPSISNVNINSGNPCIIVPPNVCVEQGAYVFELDLPIVDEEYQIVYQRCCRNNTITNILNPQSSGSTYTVILTPQAQQGCNNSPVFSGYPPGVLCVGQDFEYDFSAQDLDGDQLVYEFCSPYLGGSINGVAPDPDLPPPYQNVVFLAPNYTANVPLGASANLQIHPNTGLMTGHPMFSGQFVVGVCVLEYRNGVLLSTVRRDFQFNVTPCEITLFADLQEDSINILGEYIISSCGDSQVTLQNQSGQADFITGYKWSFDIDGNEITSTGRDFSYDFPGVGDYHGLMVVNPGSNGCTDTAKVLVQVFPGLESQFSFQYDTCIANPVAFTNLSATDGGQEIESYHWRYGDGNEETEEESPFYLYQIPGDFNVQLQIIDENGCSDTWSENINYFPVPNLIVIAPSSFKGCAPAEIFFDNLSTPIDNSYFFEWDFGDGGFDDSLSPSYTYDAPGLYTVSLNITSPIGCTTDTVFNNLIEIFSAPIANFDLDTLQLSSFDPSIEVLDASIDAVSWFYDVNSEYSSIQPSFNYVFQDTGLAYITQIVTHLTGCQDSITKYVDVVPEVTLFFPNAFTPNGDGLNDMFKPVGFFQNAKSYQFRVWNRWGEPIFYSEEPLNGWDGRKNNTGQDQHTGVYLYEAQLIGSRGGVSNYKGFITLIR